MGSVGSTILQKSIVLVPSEDISTQIGSRTCQSALMDGAYFVFSGEGPSCTLEPPVHLCTWAVGMFFCEKVCEAANFAWGSSGPRRTLHGSQQKQKCAQEVATTPWIKNFHKESHQPTVLLPTNSRQANGTAKSSPVAILAQGQGIRLST